jgi:hypothetical protein
MKMSTRLQPGCGVLTTELYTSSVSGSVSTVRYTIAVLYRGDFRPIQYRLTVSEDQPDTMLGVDEAGLDGAGMVVIRAHRPRR